MKKIILVIAAALMFVAFNYSIYQKEQTKANGETVFLQLAPVDPRSMMQGDYMALRYAIENEKVPPERTTGGYMVIGLDDKKVATFKRFHEGEALAAGEKLLHYNVRYGRVNVVPDSFMFQEGHAALYQGARYGVFKFDAGGKYILVGLADAELKEIKPEDAPKKAEPAAAVPAPAAPPAPAPAPPPSQPQ